MLTAAVLSLLYFLQLCYFHPIIFYLVYKYVSCAVVIFPFEINKVSDFLSHIVPAVPFSHPLWLSYLSEYALVLLFLQMQLQFTSHLKVKNYHLKNHSSRDFVTSIFSNSSITLYFWILINIIIFKFISSNNIYKPTRPSIYFNLICIWYLR